MFQDRYARVFATHLASISTIQSPAQYLAYALARGASVTALTSAY